MLIKFQMLIHCQNKCSDSNRIVGKIFPDISVPIALALYNTLTKLYKLVLCLTKISKSCALSTDLISLYFINNCKTFLMIHYSIECQNIPGNSTHYKYILQFAQFK